MNATDVGKIQLAVNFARNLDLRLVVKNKGHDFNAKSTGAGALTVWTTYLQDIVYLGEEYSYGTGHTGPAFKVGSGVEAIQVYEAADALDLQVVGGIARVSSLGALTLGFVSILADTYIDCRPGWRVLGSGRPLPTDGLIRHGR